MIVIASIHQPTTATFNLFSQLVLLSSGHVVYSGPTADVVPYFASQNIPIPSMTNPAEFILDVCNTDFDVDSTDVGGVESRTARLERLIGAWESNTDEAAKEGTPFAGQSYSAAMMGSPIGVMRQTFVLLHRLWMKSYRDLLAYWIRVIMYLGACSLLLSSLLSY